jgi:hypothetical protein
VGAALEDRGRESERHPRQGQVGRGSPQPRWSAGGKGWCCSARHHARVYPLCRVGTKTRRQRGAARRAASRRASCP